MIGALTANEFYQVFPQKCVDNPVEHSTIELFCDNKQLKAVLNTRLFCCQLCNCNCVLRYGVLLVTKPIWSPFKIQYLVMYLVEEIISGKYKLSKVYAQKQLWKSEEQVFNCLTCIFSYILCFKYNSFKKVFFFESRLFIICLNVTLVVQIFCFLVNFDKNFFNTCLSWILVWKTEAANRGVLCNKVLLENSQNS